MKVSLVELRRQAKALFTQKEMTGALRAFVLVVKNHPSDHGSRQALADTLAALGFHKEAVIVYRKTAELCIKAGLPFAALVSIRAIEELKDPVDDLINALVDTYNRESNQIAKVGARLNVTIPEGIAINQKELTRERSVQELVAEAVEIGNDISNVGALPPTFVIPTLFGQLSKDKLRAVIQNIWVHRLPLGHIVMKKGDQGTSCFLVARGRLRVSTKDDTGKLIELAQIGEGSLVGEMALITGSPRLANVDVIEEADLLEVGPPALAALGDELDQLAPVLDQLAQNRWLKNILDKSPFFTAIENDQRKKLLSRFSFYEVPAGVRLFDQGEQAKGIYLLLKGDVVLSEGDKRLNLAAGAMLGSRAILSGNKTASRADVLSPSTLLFLSAGSVSKLLEALPDFREQLQLVAHARTKELANLN